MSLPEPPLTGGPLPETTERINAWCEQAEAHLRTLGFPGYPHDIAVQLAIRALGRCLGVEDDVFDWRIACERMRFFEQILPGAEETAARARLLGGIVLPGQNGGPA